MSEEPRLSRRQLREMGELGPRDNAAPSLTATEELRLRRPSRRELREAELANSAAEERIRSAALRATSVDSLESQKPEPELSINSETSADSEHDPAHTETDADQSIGFGEFFENLSEENDAEYPAIAAQDSIEAPASNDTASFEEAPRPALQRTSLFDRFGDDDEEEKAPEASLQERLLQRTSEDFSEGRVAGTPDISVEHNAEEHASTDTCEECEETFEDVDDADNAVEENSSDPSVSEESALKEDEDEPAAQEQEESSGGEAEQNAATQLPVSEPVSKELDNSKLDNAKNAASSTSENEAPLISDEIFSEDAEQDLVEVEAHTSTSLFGWLVFLLIIIIGSLLGYLIGTWFAATWLSAPASLFLDVTTSVLTI